MGQGAVEQAGLAALDLDPALLASISMRDLKDTHAKIKTASGKIFKDDSQRDVWDSFTLAASAYSASYFVSNLSLALCWALWLRRFAQRTLQVLPFLPTCAIITACWTLGAVNGLLLREEPKLPFFA